jgi:peptidoglycan/LPS O-acetylase OafA/YrhL
VVDQETRSTRAEPAEVQPRHVHHDALDGLRAVGVLLVMVEHLRAFAFPSSRLLPPGGYIGVDVFFVLSGYLITSLLLSERESTGRVSFRGFYRRRAFRLFPALGAFMLVQAAGAAVTGQRLRDEVHFWIGATTYTTNWLMARGWSVPANTGHLWSLAVEEQFYLVWPLVLVLATKRWGPRSVGPVAVVGIGIALASRTYLEHRWGAGYPNVYLHTETRLDGLLLGALLAWALAQGWRPSRRAARAAGWAGLAALLAFVAWTNPTDGFLYARGGYTLLALAAAAVILAALDETWWPSRILAMRLPAAIGRLSYSLYLWHFLVLFLLLATLRDLPEPVAIAVFAAASFVPATISYRYVETPFRALGRSPRRSRDGAAQAPTSPRSGRPARPAWAVVGGGTALVVLGVVPAYAARDDIRARDEAVAAAVAQQQAAVATSVVGGGDAPGPAGPAPVAAAPVVEVPPTTAPAAAAGSSESEPAPPDDPTATTLTLGTPTVLAPTAPLQPFSVVVSATATNGSGAPLSGLAIHFDASVGACDASTDAVGRASCAISLPLGSTTPPAVDTVTATFDGDGTALPASASWP